MVRAFAIVGTLVLSMLGCWGILITIEEKDRRRGLYRDDGIPYEVWEQEEDC